MISETKMDSSFLFTQFHLEVYATQYRLEKKNAHVGVILLYIRKDIPPMLVISDLSIEGFFVEVKSRKKK